MTLRPIWQKRGVVLTTVALAAVVWFYYWTVRSSGGFNQPGDEDYYNFLVRGWRQGHLYLSKPPRPEMLALTDPYDPAQNSSVRLGDASYFRGHYYLYFGAAPAAVLMLPYGAITGREMPTNAAIYVFCVTGFLAASGLWLGVRRRYFPDSAWWIGPLGVMALGLSTHVLALERRPLVWELPIAAGFAFSMLALLAISAALHGRRPVLMMGLAGLSLGLAVASRPTCVLGAVMFFPALWQVRRYAGGASIWWRCAIAVACGLGFWVVAVLAHNFARFDDALEFGQNYQLSGVYEAKMRHFSLAYIAHNAGIYFFHPAKWTLVFPFVAATAVRGGPPGYLGEWNEAVGGLGVTFPFLWLAFAARLAWRGRTEDDTNRLRALILSVGGFFVAMLVVILGYFLATPRYLADFTPALALLAAFGWLGLERWAQRGGWNKFVAPVTAAVCLATATAGVLLSFDYHGRLLRTLQPQMWAQMERFFNSLAHSILPH